MMSIDILITSWFVNAIAKQNNKMNLALEPISHVQGNKYGRYLIAEASFPSGMNRKGTILKFASSLCRKAEPSSSITYLYHIEVLKS